jgi:hypothetical protein
MTSCTLELCVSKIAHLARAIHPARSKLKFMLGLAAYFDESGHSEDPACRFVGIGGMCAPAAAWDEFEGKWQAVLDDQCGSVPFHMNKFAAQEEPFNGWDETRRKKLLGSLVKVIKETGAQVFGSVVSLDAYDVLRQGIPQAEKFLGDPYHLCFQDVTRAAALSVIGHGLEPSLRSIEDWIEFENNERVAMVYARQKEYGTISSPAGTPQQNMGRAESLWYAIKDTNPHFGKWMGSYASAIPDELNFLQAADLFAYELTHEFENRVHRPNDPMRWGLAQLLPGSWKDFLHKFYGVPQLLELMSESGFLGPRDPGHGLSTHTSMDNIMHRDLLFSRMYDRRGKKK